MGKHGKAILDKLIRSYEKSLHANPFQDSSSRNVSYLMKKYPAYDVRDLDIVKEINGDMEELSKKGYVLIAYHPEHTNHMVRIILRMDHLDELYHEMYGRKKRSEEAIQLEEGLQSIANSCSSAWIQAFLSDEMYYLKKTGWLHSYVGKDLEHILSVLKALHYVDQGTCGYLRTMSVELYQDSKYFETELKSSFLSIVRKYEPTAQARKEIEEPTESELFRLLGFSMYPEVIESTGAMRLILQDDTILDTTPYHAGYMMSMDMVEQIKEMNVSDIDHILLVENKACYYHMLHQLKPKQLLLFSGGQFSPARKIFYEKLAAMYDGAISLWSDIDLGGFRMYARLRRELFPKLQPYRMNEIEYLHYLSYAKKVESGYLQKLKTAAENEAFQPFLQVISCILAHGKTLEQEAMLIQERS